MFKKRYLIIFLFLIVAISAISTVSAENNSTTDDIVSEDIASIENVDEETIASEDAVADEQNTNTDQPEEILASEELNEEPLTVDNSTENTIISKKVTDEPTLTSQITNKEVLSYYSEYFRDTLQIHFIKQTGKYTNNKKVYFKVVDETIRMRAANIQIKYTVYKSNGALETWGYATTNSNGIGCIKFTDGKSHIGTFKIKAKLYWWPDSYTDTVYGDSVTLKNVKIYKERLKIRVHRLNTFYKSHKKFKIKILDSHNKRVGKVRVRVNIYTGYRHKTLYLKTNAKGVAVYKGVSKLRAGKHKIRITIVDKRYLKKSVVSYIKVQKKVKIYAKPETKRIGGVLTVLVKDRASNKFINGIKVKIRFRGSSKTLDLITGYDPDIRKNGVVGIATNMLSVGTHKLKIIVNTGKYKGSANSKLVIPQSGKLYKNWVAVFSNGKTGFKYVN